MFRDQANGYDIGIRIKVDGLGQLILDQSFVTAAVLPLRLGLVVFGDPCLGAGAGPESCVTQGQELGEGGGKCPRCTTGARCAGSEVWLATGSTDEYNNPIYEDLHGNRAVGCGVGPLNTIKLVYI